MTISTEILSLLKTRGWVQQAASQIEGPNCLLGALAAYSIPYRHDTSARWRRIIKEQYPERHYEYVSSFNDDPRTTFADIRLVLEKAAVEEAENG